MDIMTVLSSIGPALETGKKVLKAVEEFKNVELKMQVGEMASSLCDAKFALAEVKDELDKKDKEIKKLKEAFHRREKETIMYSGFRYARGPDGLPSGNAFCPLCDEQDGLLIMLRQLFGKPGRLDFCPKCKTEYVSEHFAFTTERRPDEQIS